MAGASEVLEIFEGDSEGAGYPRNGKACRRGMLVLGPAQRLPSHAQPGGKMIEAPSGNQRPSASGAREEEGREGRELQIPRKGPGPGGAGALGTRA